MRCMSPLMAFPVPFVGSKPLPSVGINTVSEPPAWGGCDGALDGPAVICTCCWGLAVVEVDAVPPALGCLAVVADRVVPPGVFAPVVEVVTPGSASVVDESADAEVVAAESVPGGS